MTHDPGGTVYGQNAVDVVRTRQFTRAWTECTITASSSGDGTARQRPRDSEMESGDASFLRVVELVS
jgi:hypothetical protein